MTARVVLLAGPSGSGKTRLACGSGLPVLPLDDFYRDGDDPALPRDPELGIVDWDDPRSWDAQAAVAAIEHACRHGWVDIPVYDLAHDRATAVRRVEVGPGPVLVAEGIFAAEVIGPCRERGLLADAVVVRRAPWKNFVRRLVRDLAERRKPPLVLVRRGLALLRDERAVLARQVALGAHPCDAAAVGRRLRRAASGSAATGGRSGHLGA